MRHTTVEPGAAPHLSTEAKGSVFPILVPEEGAHLQGHLLALHLSADEARWRLKGHLSRRQPLFIGKTSGTSCSVATHFALAAVGVVELHKKASPFTGGQEDEPIGTDAFFSVAKTTGNHLPGSTGIIRAQDHQKVVAVAVHFPKFHDWPSSIIRPKVTPCKDQLVVNFLTSPSSFSPKSKAKAPAHSMPPGVSPPATS